MYWPIGTPRIYAAPFANDERDASNSDNSSVSDNAGSGRPPFSVVVSHDGIPTSENSDNAAPGGERSDSVPQLVIPDAELGGGNNGGLLRVDNPSSGPPLTPTTPGIKSVEQDEQDENGIGAPASEAEPGLGGLPRREPVLALRVARSGQLFATVTARTITVWQTKPTVILAVVVRSPRSLSSYGSNVELLLRPDSAILVVQTSLGYLITYSLATDADARVYKPHFPNRAHVLRRRQNHPHAATTNFDAEDIYWGPGEGGGGPRDVSVRFRMVIRVDAGIESALALDDELVVATRRPAAVQCIRWTPDSSGSQTSTELLSRMAWLNSNGSGSNGGGNNSSSKKMTIRDMTHDRPMNLSTWVTSDGRAYAVQRSHAEADSASAAANPETKKQLFRGFCFHVPEGEHDHGLRAVINARFSLIAVGCADGIIRVYSARDYSGNIPASHSHKLPVSISTSGPLRTLAYSPDGYCLFAGFDRGWATWSVYGKALSHSFGADDGSSSAPEAWIAGIRDAAWVGGACEMLLVAREHEAIWLLEMARSAVTGCYSAANLFRTVLQTTSSVMVYRGYDLPDLTSISAEPFLWHTARIPPAYLLNQWPIRCTVTSADGRYVAVAGRRGLAHYSVASGRWKTFASAALENEFQVRGGMCWHQNVLVAAVETTAKTYELRLLARDAPLDVASTSSGISSASTSTTNNNSNNSGSAAEPRVSSPHVQPMPAPVVLITPSGEDSLLVYTYDNLLYHFVFVPVAAMPAVRLVQVGQIAFHGIVRSPARVRGLSWALPEAQLVDGDPSQDVALASVLFLVDGKLVLLRPSLNDEGRLKYDMRVVSHTVEYHACVRDQPFALPGSNGSSGNGGPNGGAGEAQQQQHQTNTIQDSLWIFDGRELAVWTDMEAVLNAVSSEASRELPPTVSVPVDFYPLSILTGKGVVLGVEPDLVQRRDVSFSYFRFSIRTHLFLPDILRFYLAHNQPAPALRLAQQYQHLEYFPHALEVLLHHVLDAEVDAQPPPPPPDAAVLPRVLSLLSSFPSYLDVVVRCTRKTELRSWRTLFAYLPPPMELFEESLLRGSLKTAGGYLLVLHTFDDENNADGDNDDDDDGDSEARARAKLSSSAGEQSVRLLARAMREHDWDLCRELARFLAAMDASGDTLRAALEMARVRAGLGPAPSASAAPAAPNITSRLEVPAMSSRGRTVNGGAGSGAGEDGAASS